MLIDVLTGFRLGGKQVDTAVSLGPKFSRGIFIAISADRTCHFYS